MTVFQAIVLLQLALATEFNDFNYDEQKPNNNNNEKKEEKKRLTSIVNLPVSNSVRNGSDIGLMLSRSSTLRINSCCSNNSTARCTSSFRANTNFRAVDGEIVFRSILLFITSMNSLTACRGKNEQKRNK